MTKPSKLDAAISESVLGYTTNFEKNGSMRETLPNGQSRPLRAYSQDISAAWEVVQKLGISLIPVEQGWFAMVGEGGGWKSPAEFLTFLQKGEFTKSGAAVGEHAPMTICLAAIKAVEHRKAAVDPAFPQPVVHGDLPIPVFQN